MVHTFKCLDRLFMLDIESGSLYQIDELTKKLIDKKNSSGESTGEFSGYSQAEIDEVNDEINDLMKEGSLFLMEQSHEKPKAKVIKAMCLNISHKCNLACEYCFADGGSYSGEKENMSFEVAKAAIDLLIKESKYRTNLEVDFFGGEPLLNIDVVKKTVEYARSIEKQAGKNFRFTITTNALNLTDEIINFFNKEMYNVVISIDGRKDVHNTVRKTVGGQGSFDIALKNALNFRKKRGDKLYYIRGTYTALNKDFSSDVLALNDYGFDQISIEPVVLPDDHKLALHLDDVPELSREYEKLASEYIVRRETKEKWFSFFHFVMDIDNGPCELKRISSCGAGGEYIAVVPNGNIYPCHQFAGNDSQLMGNVNEGIFKEPLKDEYKNENYSNNVSAYFSSNNILCKSSCKECWAKYYCSGGCAANAFNFNKSITSPHELSCQLMKKRLECALAIYAVERE